MYFAFKQRIDDFSADDLVHLKKFERYVVHRPAIRHRLSGAFAAVSERMKNLPVNLEHDVVGDEHGRAGTTFCRHSPEESDSLTF